MVRRGQKSDRIEELDSEPEEVGGRLVDKAPSPVKAAPADDPAAAATDSAPRDAAADEDGAPANHSRPTFSVSIEDLILYILCIAAGYWCFYLALNSPKFSVYRCRRMKWPVSQTQAVRFIGWWALAIGMLLCGAGSMLFGTGGIFATVAHVAARGNAMLAGGGGGSDKKKVKNE